jgi:hypothetical protein
MPDCRGNVAHMRSPYLLSASSSETEVAWDSLNSNRAAIYFRYWCLGASPKPGETGPIMSDKRPTVVETEHWLDDMAYSR